MQVGCLVFLQLDVVEYCDYGSLSGNHSWVGKKKRENMGGVGRGISYSWKVPRQSLEIKVHLMWWVLKMQGKLKDLQPFLLPFMVVIWEEKGDEDGATGWKLFWTPPYPQRIKKTRHAFSFLQLARKKMLELNLSVLDLSNTMLLWNCQMHVVKQVI